MRKEKIYRSYLSVLSIAKQLCWFISQINGVAKVGLFGSLALEKPEAGDIDIVIFLKSRKIPEILLKKYEIFSESEYGIYEYCIDQIKYLLMLQDQGTIGKADACLALINSYDVRVDTLLLPVNPTYEYLHEFINYGRGDIDFLPHVVRVLKVYDPATNKFSKYRLPWASKVEAIHKEIEILSGTD